MSTPATTEHLRIIHYPDPRLRKVSEPVKSFDVPLRELVGRMFELMREDKGVGLAAPQVGINQRLFVINPTGKPEDDRVYINPQMSEPIGEDEAEEGCLSLPEIRVNVLRAKSLHMRAQNLDGEWFEEHADGYVARIWQHENDHLEGILLLDKMSALDKLAARKAIKQMEADYAGKKA
jgi:peptide deformylase